MIRDIGLLFGFSEAEVASVRARHFTAGSAARSDDLTSSYEILGTTAAATDDEVKAAHRALVRKFHPDHLVSKGLPDELIEHATGRLAAINAAYEAVMNHRAAR